MDLSSVKNHYEQRFWIIFNYYRPRWPGLAQTTWAKLSTEQASEHPAGAMLCWPGSQSGTRACYKSTP